MAGAPSILRAAAMTVAAPAAFTTSRRVGSFDWDIFVLFLADFVWKLIFCLSGLDLRLQHRRGRPFPRSALCSFLMARRAAVFGCSGQLGVELVRELKARGYDVQGWERAAVDITNREKVERVLAGFDPKLVFNAAAYNQVDVAEREPQAAYVANALAVRNLALACRQVDARLVHYSTDYVFDGALGRPYHETDATHPLGAYAVSKLAGELYAQAYLERPLVVRTSGVFGPAGRTTARGNFVELMLRLAGSGQPIRVVEDHSASPTYAPLLAARAADLVERGATGVF